MPEKGEAGDDREVDAFAFIGRGARSASARPTDALGDGSVVGEADSTAWAVPFTDMTMLLIVFFVVMLSQADMGSPSTSERDASQAGSSTSLWSDWPDPREEADKRNAEPSSSTLFDAGEGVLPGGRDFAHRQSQRDAEFAAEWRRRVEALEATADRYLENNDLSDQVALSVTETGIELRMAEDILFSSGSADLEASGTELIASLAPLLRDIDGDVQVSGHTDDVPIRTARFPSNWELSAARAIAVVLVLTDRSVPERKMHAVGHGASRPVASNDDPAGRAANRRVAIDVTPRPKPVD